MTLQIIREIINGGYSHVVRPFYNKFYSFGEEIDPLKIIKLKILASLADETNFEDIFTELTFYSEQENTLFQKVSLRLIGDLAVRFPSRQQGILDYLRSLLETNNPCYDGLIISLRKFINLKNKNIFIQGKFFRDLGLWTVELKTE